MEEEENRAIQSINKTPAQKAAKRRKLNEEVEDLKRHLEIVPDEDDDVYTEATPLARKDLVHCVRTRQYLSMGDFGNRYHQKDKIQAKPDKTEHKMESVEKSTKVNKKSTQSKSKTDPRSRVDPTLLNNFEMATDKNGDPPVSDLRTMEELCQPTLNGRGGPIAPIAIQAMNFGLKNDMIQQVQNSCQFHGLPGDDANKHLDKFLHVS
nr:reverse transcriptase domain-containing protein [Tanacetum cinerariifolium]